jgi:hypothetical protein
VALLPSPSRDHTVLKTNPQKQNRQNLFRKPKFVLLNPKLSAKPESIRSSRKNTKAMENKTMSAKP